MEKLIGQPGFEPGTPSPPDLYAKPTALLPDKGIHSLFPIYENLPSFTISVKAMPAIQNSKKML